jgi:hypothetical protein
MATTTAAMTMHWFNNTGHKPTMRGGIVMHDHVKRSKLYHWLSISNSNGLFHDIGQAGKRMPVRQLQNTDDR